MRFENSGLPNEPLIQKAFELSWKSAKKRAVSDVMQTISLIKKDVDSQVKALEAQGLQVPKGDLQAQIDAAVAKNTQIIMAQRDEDFKNRVINPALKLASAKASPEAISASLVVDTIKSPLDYELVVKTLGTVTSNIVAQYIDMVIYQSEESDKLLNAKEDIKLVHLAILVSDMEEMSSIKVPAGKVPQLVGGLGTAKRWFTLGKISRGLNADLDKGFVDTFNKLGVIFGLNVKATVNPTGGLVLMKKRQKSIAAPKTNTPPNGNPPAVQKKPTPKPGNPSGPKSLGKPVF